MKRPYLLCGIPLLFSLLLVNSIGAPFSFINESMESVHAAGAVDTLQLNLAKSVFDGSNKYGLGLNTSESPDQMGRLGRNKQFQMYSSADWQRTIWIYTQNVLVSRDPAGLENVLKGLELPFMHQLADGNFKFVALPSTTVSPEQQRSSVCVGGCYFFIASFAASANALEQSDWFQTAPENAPYRARLKALKPKVLRSLNYLSSEPNLSTLRTGSIATNRLWMKALALYGGGKFADSLKHRQLGLEFANKAYSQFDPSTGIFLEYGGGDSSYQMISLINATLFATQLPPNDPFRAKILSAVVKGARWELTKILPTGEVSTKDNTRVKPGGESFLGTQKTVSIPDVVRGLAYAGALSGDLRFWEASQRVAIWDKTQRAKAKAMKN